MNTFIESIEVPIEEKLEVIIENGPQIYFDSNNVFY